MTIRGALPIVPNIILVDVLIKNNLGLRSFYKMTLLSYLLRLGIMKY